MRLLMGCEPMWDVIRYLIGNVSNSGWKNVGFGKSSHWEREQSWDLLVHLLGM
jgi:hypothetical protein